MIKAVFAVVCILLSAIGSFSQTAKTPPKVVPIASSTLAEIHEKDWNEILKTLEAENWTLANSLVSQSFVRLKAENEKKQLARLRYFYLYSLAGKVSRGRTTFAELEKITDGMIGKDFLMPPRKVLADCQKSLNFICAVKNYSKTVRFTAANKTFDSIHSFEYFLLPDILDVVKLDGIEIVMGGKLKKVEFNPKKDTSWIMRLYFENGTATQAIK